MASMLKKHMQMFDLEDAGIFWDFGSLFQGPKRDADQQQKFDDGLKASNIWYASALSTVWT